MDENVVQNEIQTLHREINKALQDMRKQQKPIADMPNLLEELKKKANEIKMQCEATEKNLPMQYTTFLEAKVENDKEKVNAEFTKFYKSHEILTKLSAVRAKLFLLESNMTPSVAPAFFFDPLLIGSFDLIVKTPDIDRPLTKNLDDQNDLMSKILTLCVTEIRQNKQEDASNATKFANGKLIQNKFQEKKVLGRSISDPGFPHPVPNRGGKPHTLKFYQAIARSRGIPFSGVRKADLIKAIKNHKPTLKTIQRTRATRSK
jgi:hypothetical protein